MDLVAPLRRRSPELRKQACGNKLTIARVPYSLDRAKSGVTVTVKLPDGRELVDRDVVVEDIFIVAFGDSFASGESNPDRPVQFSPSRQMVYDPKLLRDEIATGSLKNAPQQQGFGLASRDGDYNPKVLPRRYMEDEVNEKFYQLSSSTFETAFEKAGARWLSRDCHRSQYGYPFRVGIQLALENRHRSVTLASFTCSGADVVHGMFLEMDAREDMKHDRGKVRAQFDQLSDLLCRGGAAGRTQSASYALPMYSAGSTSIQVQPGQQGVVSAAGAQAADRSRADVGRRQ